MKIHEIKKENLKYIEPAFSHLSKDDILKQIMAFGEKRLNYGGFHPTRAMSYMMRIPNKDIIQHIHQINEYRKIEKDNYILYPYTFDFKIHNSKTNIIKADWFSGMGQGFALIAYSRQNNRKIADKILNSFESDKFTEQTDFGNHYMEYPNHCYALNGHIFALYGLYEYWYRFKTNKAKHLLIEGIKWVKSNFHKYRNIGDASFYCSDHKVLCNRQGGKYHKVHIEQLEYLTLLTGDNWFSDRVKELKDDFNVSGDVVVLSNERI